MTSAPSLNIDSLPLSEDFAALFAEDKNQIPFGKAGDIIKGDVLRLDKENVFVDVNLKSEGKIALKQFEGEETPKPGDVIDVFIEAIEGPKGEIVLSRERARREKIWTELFSFFESGKEVLCKVNHRVKGGFRVDVLGTTAFLPGSQVDIRPVRDPDALIGIEENMRILKFDRVHDQSRVNVVVSRRVVLEETREEQRKELVQHIAEGKIVTGVVKNITDYGAFVDLGGMDGLLHVTDISWRRINHPSEALEIGQEVTVQIIRYNAQSQRISLGIKHLESNPWENITVTYPVRATFPGKVTNIAEYGAFVELEPGIEGLVHVSEMRWEKKAVDVQKMLNIGDEVNVMVLEIDVEKKRISLGIKQTMVNPWIEFVEKHPIGSTVQGKVKNVTNYGVFVGLTDQLDGMVYVNDIDWELRGDEALQLYSEGDEVEVKVQDVLVDKERISLSIKETKTEPASATDELGLKKGKVVTCVISEVTENGLAVLVGDKVKGFIRRGELARERGEQRPDRFAAGERVDAKIINASSGNREMSLSIRALEIQEEKEAVEAYGSADSGAVLGDILGFSGLTASSDDAAAAPAEKEEKPAKAKKKPAKAAAPKAEMDEAPEAPAVSEEQADPVAEEAPAPEGAETESAETEPAKDENA